MESGVPLLSRTFQSTHPVRGGTSGRFCIPIFYVFQSTHPVRGGTSGADLATLPEAFQSTHPVRGGTNVAYKVPSLLWISIHPPREGWDLNRIQNRRCLGISIHPPREGWDGVSSPERLLEHLISIHPPREGWDADRSSSYPDVQVFQSTHPVRGGTHRLQCVRSHRRISIHPPREGWDRILQSNIPCSSNFNPPTP